MLAASGLTSKWSFGFGMRTSQLVLHQWPVSSFGEPTYAAQRQVTQGCSRAGGRPAGLCLWQLSTEAEIRSVFPQNHLCRPPGCHQMAATCKSTQPGQPPREVPGRLAPCRHFPAPRASRCPAGLLLWLMQPPAPVADQFPWPHHWSVTAPVAV